MGLKIAYTYNLNRHDTPEEAEYDDIGTVDAIARALESAGHAVERVDAAGSVADLVMKLEKFRPDLVFNTAEGKGGRHREAFYPALFDTMGIPYTGSDAYTCMVTLDKAWTKEILSKKGISTPGFALVTTSNGDARELYDSNRFKYPIILKPNSEGSSMGIDEDSVVYDREQLKRRLDFLLCAFPQGVLVEEFISGIDVAVPYISGVGPEALDIIRYHYGEDSGGSKIYSYELKHGLDRVVSALVPADIPAETAKKLKSWSALAVHTLGIKDICRFDFRISRDGEPYFIEVNALPSLQPNAGLFESAALHGLDFNTTINAVVESAVRRYGIPMRKKRVSRRAKSVAGRSGLTVGFVFNMKRVGADVDDSEAEFDSPATIEAIKAAIESHGHRVELLEADSGLPALLSKKKIDVVFNMAEGTRGRSRESQVPALCEMLGIEHTGSDAMSLMLALDKGLTKRVLKNENIFTPDFFLMETGDERVPAGMKYPMIVKPNYEGTSKGISSASVVDDEAALRETAKAVIERYSQPVIVEEYIEGREISIGFVGWPEPRALPVLGVVFLEPGERPVYSYELKQDWEGKLDYEIPANITESERKACIEHALKSYKALGCRDVARVDIRLSHDGTPYVLEVNPLPGLGPEFSDLPKIAYAAGMDYNTLIGEVLSGGIKRLNGRKALHATPLAARA